MGKFVARRHASVREVAGTQPAEHAMMSREIFADLLKSLLVHRGRRDADAAGELNAVYARDFQNPLDLGIQALDLSVDHFTKILGNLQADLVQRNAEGPCSSLVFDKPALLKMFQGRKHEQGISLRVPLQQCRQTLRYQCFRWP